MLVGHRVGHDNGLARACGQVVEVGARREDELVVDDGCQTLACRCGDRAQGEAVAVIDVGVVGQDVDGQRLVFCCGCHVGNGHRPVVGADDRDGDRLIHVGAEIVGHAHGVALLDRLALFKGLRGSERVVEGVGPAASGCVDGQAAVGGRGRALDGPGLRGARIDVAYAELAAHAVGTRHGGAVSSVTGLCHVAEQLGCCVGDHGHVVGACDGDGNLLCDDTAVLVIQRNLEDLGLRLPLCQILDFGSGHRIRPCELAARASSCRVAVLDRRENS